MNKKNKILIPILILLIIAFLFVICYRSYILNNINNTKNEDKEIEVDELLTEMMKNYGNKLINNREWMNNHKVDDDYYIYLDEIIKDSDFDKNIFELIDCDFDNTALIIKISDLKPSLSTELKCIINKDSKGHYYNIDALNKLIITYGEAIINVFDYESDEELVNYDIPLKQIEEIYKLDISMFKQNYDLENSHLRIIVNKDKEGNYTFDYESILITKGTST